MIPTAADQKRWEAFLGLGTLLQVTERLVAGERRACFVGVSIGIGLLNSAYILVMGFLFCFVVLVLVVVSIYCKEKFPS